MNQLYVYIYPHIPSLLHFPPSYPPYPTPLGGHKAWSWSPCAMWLLPTIYFTFGSAYMSMPLSHLQMFSHALLSSLLTLSPSIGRPPSIRSLSICIPQKTADIFISITLKLWIDLRRIEILLRLLTHEHGIFLNLFRSSLISLKIFCGFYCIGFAHLLSDLFLYLDATVNGIVFSFQFPIAWCYYIETQLIFVLWSCGTH